MKLQIGLGKLLGIISLLGFGAALIQVPVVCAIRYSRETSCMSNLSQLNKMLNICSSRGGPEIPASAKGGEFWLSMSRAVPPLLTPEHYDLYLCPVRRGATELGRTDYRGPAGPVRFLESWAPIGADKEANHGDGCCANVLLKDGGVMSVEPDSELWLEARTVLSP